MSLPSPHLGDPCPPLGQRLAAWLRAKLPRRWRENPLLLREAGLADGQSIFRSRFALLLALLIVYVVHEQTLRLAHLGDPRAQHAHFWFRFLAAAIPFFIALYCCAFAWGREARDESLRHQLALTALTPAQIVRAKATLWLGVVIAVDLIDAGLKGIWHILQILATYPNDPDSYAAPPHSLLLWVGLGNVLRLIISMGVNVLAFAAASHLALSRLSPIFACLLGGGIAISVLYALLYGVLFIPFLIPLGVLYWSDWVWELITSMVIAALAPFLWRRLPRRVARLYGRE